MDIGFLLVDEYSPYLIHFLTTNPCLPIIWEILALPHMPENIFPDPRETLNPKLAKGDLEYSEQWRKTVYHISVIHTPLKCFEHSTLSICYGMPFESTGPKPASLSPKLQILILHPGRKEINPKP